jgi:glycosyltransferase 2 family protein
MPFNRLGRAALGLVISVVALALVFRSVDVGAAWDIVKGAQQQWVALLVLFVIGDVLLRALRWRVLLRPLARTRYSDTLASLLVGYLGNNVLPARLGEVVRSHDFGERTGISKSTILGTIVIERVVDTLVVVSIAAVAILVLSVRGIVASAVLVGLAVTVLLVVVIGVGMAAHRLPGAERARDFLGRWPRVRHVLSKLRVGLSVVGSGRTMALAIVLSVASWSLTVLAFAAAGQAVGVEPTIGQAALLAAGTNLATAIPAAPGYVGTFELAVVTIGASVGIPRESALALGILVHVVALLVTSVGGAAVLVLGGRRRRGPSAARPAEHTSDDAAGTPSQAPVLDAASKGDR